MLIDHVGIDVADFERALSFYDAAFRPLMIGRLTQLGPEQGAEHGVVGYGKTLDSHHPQCGKPSFWIAGAPGKAPTSVHVAFAADSENDVKAFHAAALAAGGRDNGGPGERPHYHKGYYAAFVLDPDGHNIEAVFHNHGIKAEP